MLVWVGLRQHAQDGGKIAITSLANQIVGRLFFGSFWLCCLCCVRSRASAAVVEFPATDRLVLLAEYSLHPNRDASRVWPSQKMSHQSGITGMSSRQQSILWYWFLNDLVFFPSVALQQHRILMPCSHTFATTTIFVLSRFRLSTVSVLRLSSLPPQTNNSLLTIFQSNWRLMASAKQMVHGKRTTIRLFSR